jgi:AraC-like DNA-binding protein
VKTKRVLLVAMQKEADVMTPTFSSAGQVGQLATLTGVTSAAAKDKVIQPNLRASHSDLEILMTMLEVNVSTLTESLISPGWQLSFAATKMAGIHYNLAGTGQITVGHARTIPLTPHTLVVTPPGQPFRIDAATGQGAASMTRVAEVRSEPGDVSGTVQRFSAGSSEPEVTMISSYIRATYSSSIDLFAALASPIVERFDAADQLGHRLKGALAELVAQQVGMKAMATALLKQVVISLLRRSLSSKDLWLERFSVLSDPQVARAFTQMVGRLGAPHSVTNLSQTAGLSRSVFMARFASAFGCSPMAALRQMRMRKAADLLTANILSIEQIAHIVGYRSHRGFSRAFRQTYGEDPADHRAAASVHQHGNPPCMPLPNLS